MVKVTKEQYDLLDGIERALSKTLIEKHFDGDSNKAVAALKKNTGFGERASIINARLRFTFAKSAGYDVRAKKLLSYCDKAVPALTKTFGEAALVDALPIEARTKEVAELSEELGAPRVAALVRKTL